MLRAVASQIESRRITSWPAAFLGGISSCAHVGVLQILQFLSTDKKHVKLSGSSKLSLGVSESINGCLIASL